MYLLITCWVCRALFRACSETLSRSWSFPTPLSIRKKEDLLYYVSLTAANTAGINLHYSGKRQIFTLLSVPGSTRLFPSVHKRILQSIQNKSPLQNWIIFANFLYYTLKKVWVVFAMYCKHTGGG